MSNSSTWNTPLVQNDEPKGPPEPPIHIVYTGQTPPVDAWKQSVFLAGPTRRQDPDNPQEDKSSWRKEAVKLLEQHGFRGVVYYPEYAPDAVPGTLSMPTYEQQVRWEINNLNRADCIMFWVPRDLTHLPAFTTNIEFGKWCDSGKVVLGYPPGTPKMRYMQLIMDALGGTRCFTLELAIKNVMSMVGKGALRGPGENSVPLMVWNLESFQKWYQSLQNNGNRLDDARVLWTFTLPNNSIFAWVLWVKIWIEAEQRWKYNEFVFSRPDTSMILMYRMPPSDRADVSHRDLMKAEVVLVKEFRSPVRNTEGMVVELAGGSSFKPDQDHLQVAMDEVKEETGIEIPKERFKQLKHRQVAATLAAHHAHLFVVELTAEEMAQAREAADAGETHGVEADTERTYLEVSTIKQLLDNGVVDWATLGMIFEGLVTDQTVIVEG